MLSSTSITRRGLALSGIALALLGLPRFSTAAHEDAERTQLAAIVRQLDQLQQQTARASALAPQERRRYHLDYARLQADLQRIRGGLQDYLTPARAQPRDVEALSADYRAEDASRANGADEVRSSTEQSAPRQEERKP